MDYSRQSDNEIIRRISDGDDDAMEYMMKKYGSLVKKEIRTVYIIGAETEDLAQEGMIGLFKAIKDFEPDKGASFPTFATLCIKRQIKTAITASNRQKHKPLNTYISIYAESNEKGTLLGEDIADTKDAANPERLVLVRERNNVLNERIASELSSLERKVLKLYLDGLSYADIAAALSKTEKSVDNALWRIRSKLSK
ncbi:MAG: sigma-70 family RNA polymerase sigma factor [Clostridium sp.]|nr:sigma-70 family RNA polymerase sigma factor [Clostridium sp.]MCM1398085.1 sigma-70 family RNA polymerase sigma factor [Clostridium sp.]MCM1459281.1 sigma-70 family RNA polymerase sigma factor [Bacteroides sp.]